MGGTFSLVLHSHLPYVRGAGRWPHGEEWVHEAILGTYLPLLIALHDLRAQGVPFRITIGLTPPLLEQLADAQIKDRFLEYVDDQIRRAHIDANDTADSGDASRGLVASEYRDRFVALRAAFLDRFSRDLPGAFASLARTGELEILWSAATHGYLPLLDERSIELQLAAGRATTRRVLGLEPGGGLWLPECAYRPGLETHLERHGITHVVVDPALVAGRPTFRVDGSSYPQRSGAGLTTPSLDRAAAVPIRAHLIRASRVAAIARHQEISFQVWSAAYGFPGDPHYREFHRKDERSGLRYWRVTARDTDLGAKAAYVPELARERVRVHAAHFVDRVRDELALSQALSGSIVAAFDSELFGHWWYEGVEWLALVLRELAQQRVPSATLAESLHLSPPNERVSLAEGSWGANNDDSTWLNLKTTWMHESVRVMAARLHELMADPPREARRGRAARQAVRELLLAEASDWPFLITTGQAPEYAAERFRVHEDRFHEAMTLATAHVGEIGTRLEELEELDPVFAEATLAG